MRRSAFAVPVLLPPPVSWCRLVAAGAGRVDRDELVELGCRIEQAECARRRRRIGDIEAGAR